MSSSNPVGRQGQVMPFQYLLEKELEHQIELALLNVPAPSRKFYSEQIMEGLKQFGSLEDQLVNVTAIAESLIGKPLVDEGGAPIVSLDPSQVHPSHVVRPDTMFGKGTLLKTLALAITRVLNKPGVPCQIEEVEFKRIHARFLAGHCDDLFQVAQVFKKFDTYKIPLIHCQGVVRAFSLAPQPSCHDELGKYMPVTPVQELIEAYAYPDFLNFLINHVPEFLQVNGGMWPAGKRFQENEGYLGLWVEIAISGVLHDLGDVIERRFSEPRFPNIQQEVFRVIKDFYEWEPREGRPQALERIKRVLRGLSDESFFRAVADDKNRWQRLSPFQVLESWL